MIQEAYCSFEVAKLLKEKGFDELCIFEYNNEGIRMKAGVAIDEWQNSELDDNEYSAPTHQMAMAWLREVHKLHIITIPYAPRDRHPLHHPGKADLVYIAQLFRGIIPIDEVGRSIIKLTHEEAVEAAIKYCLENLI